MEMKEITTIPEQEFPDAAYKKKKRKTQDITTFLETPKTAKINTPESNLVQQNRYAPLSITLSNQMKV